MFEVEAKVRISEQDMERIGAEIISEKYGPYISVGLIEKTDAYYRFPTSDVILRHRFQSTGVNQDFLTVKSRSWDGGVEVNKEVEILANPVSGSVSEFVSYLGCVIDIIKIKRCLEYEFTDHTVGLNVVESLGCFLEIEYMAKNEQEIPELSQKLLAKMQQLGYTERDFIIQNYIELLRAVNVNVP